MEGAAGWGEVSWVVFFFSFFFFGGGGQVVHTVRLFREMEKGVAGKIAVRVSASDFLGGPFCGAFFVGLFQDIFWRIEGWGLGFVDAR